MAIGSMNFQGFSPMDWASNTMGQVGDAGAMADGSMPTDGIDDTAAASQSADVWGADSFQPSADLGSMSDVSAPADAPPLDDPSMDPNLMSQMQGSCCDTYA